MNAQRLLAYYDRVADAPDAIARLRRFILDLAVRGKLVPQDPKDEPAAELLKKIAKEKARLVKTGEARKSNIDPANEEDAQFSIPSNGTWTRLGSIADWGSGSTPPRGNSDFYGGSIPWLKSGELNDNRALAGAEETVTQLAIDKGTFRLNKPGDVLLAMYGATIGKVAILAERAVTNQAVCGCTPFAGVFNQFLFLFLLSQREQFHSASEGGAQPNISKIKIVWTPFPLPPLSEQHRIVAKVDELMALCDRLEAARTAREATRDRLAAASLARLNDPDPDTFPANVRFVLDALSTLTARPDQIKQLRQTILNLAVRGKLVLQDPNDEPAEELLRRLKKAQIERSSSEGLRARTPVSKLNRADLWFEFPESWALSFFDDIFLIVSGVTKGQKVSALKALDVPYLRVANVQRGKLDLAVIKTITVQQADQERYALRHGDILMTEGGDWDKLGRAAIWQEEIPGCIHQNHIFRVRPPSGDVLPEWVVNYANSLLGRAFFEEASKQTTNLASINMTQLRGCPLPLPPLPEQHRIVAKVNELMALCDRLEAGLAAAADTRRHLLDALLAVALAPTDSKGEAAE